jgi:hypothetical protein
VARPPPQLDAAGELDAALLANVGAHLDVEEALLAKLKKMNADAERGLHLDANQKPTVEFQRQCAALRPRRSVAPPPLPHITHPHTPTYTPTHAHAHLALGTLLAGCVAGAGFGADGAYTRGAAAAASAGTPRS